MRLVLRLLVISIFSLCTPAWSQDVGQIQQAITQLLTGGQRMALPVERIRPALTAHYARNGGSIYWIGTGRMDKFIHRLQSARYDGLNPQDYPVQSLMELRDQLDESDPVSAAQAELTFSAFLVSYAADLRIGRIAPQKVDPNLFRSQKTIDVQRVLTD
jgi:L,D-transpeptidase YcbB